LAGDVLAAMGVGHGAEDGRVLMAWDGLTLPLLPGPLRRVLDLAPDVMRRLTRATHSSS
jgi:hypothetical protein